MPVYEYACTNHGITTRMRSIGERDGEVHCPECGGLAHRTVSAPRLQTMSAANRTAWARNEQSAHEPVRHRRAACGHHHAAGTSCGSQHNGAQTGLKRAGAGSRPWMLGH